MDAIQQCRISELLVAALNCKSVCMLHAGAVKQDMNLIESGMIRGSFWVSFRVSIRVGFRDGIYHVTQPSICTSQPDGRSPE